MQFAQRLRNTADEEAVELDRADEAAETEVGEELHRPHSNDNC